jgi:transposase-like protein
MPDGASLPAGQEIREDPVVRNKAVYPALGILFDGSRDILGLLD